MGSVSEVFVKYVSVGGGVGGAGQGLMGDVTVCLWDNSVVVCCLLEVYDTWVGGCLGGLAVCCVFNGIIGPGLLFSATVAKCDGIVLGTVQ